MKNNFVPFEKRSKKEKRKLATAQRKSWNGVKPATRIMESGRKKKLEKIQKNETHKAMLEE